VLEPPLVFVRVPEDPKQRPENKNTDRGEVSRLTFEVGSLPNDVGFA
jgi:hypothetical protein